MVGRGGVLRLRAQGESQRAAEPGPATGGLKGPLRGLASGSGPRLPTRRFHTIPVRSRRFQTPLISPIPLGS